MDQQFSLSWNNFHGNLTKGFASLLGNGEFVDVTIAVDGHLLQAHKVILSICSPYFKRMFQLNPCQHPIVVLRDVTHKAMRDLLQFMYHGEVSVKREDLTSFIGTAEVLQIKGLTNKETEGDEIRKEAELPKYSADPPKTHTPEPESSITDPFECNTNDEIPQNSELNLLKQKEFLEKLQRLSNLKRKSEELIQKNYYTEILNAEKRAKIKEKSSYRPNLMAISNYEKKNPYEDNPLEITHPFKTLQHVSNTNTEANDKQHDIPQNVLEIKTECDDMDIVVTDPAICTTPKSFDASRDGKKDTSPTLNYHSPQDNCPSLNSLFMDLKNLVNGKVTNNVLRSNSMEDYPRQTSEHRLVTIPQKEDGKKKYPQRSCRLCWKIGKRRDTRFMCSACELPFCKTPCFEIHYNDTLKITQYQGDYYVA